MKHLKQILSFAAAFCLLLSLSACGGDSAAAFDPSRATKAVLESGAFSVALEELEAETLYDFSGYGLDASALTGAQAYSASGFAEQVSVTLWKDEAAAKAAVEMFQAYLEDMAESYRDYAPTETPKLEKAIVEQRGTSVLLVVADDAAKAQSALDGLK